jgi:hypothetical protein
MTRTTRIGRPGDEFTQQTLLERGGCAVAGALVDEGAMPEFEHEKRPQPAFVMGSALHVVVKILLN